MIHQPLGGAQGQETDLEIQVNSQHGTMEDVMLFLDQYGVLTKDILSSHFFSTKIRISDFHTQLGSRLLYIAYCFFLSLYCILLQANETVF
jgi:hypothetical protein